jgi:hypothetical protein
VRHIHLAGRVVHVEVWCSDGKVQQVALRLLRHVEQRLRALETYLLLQFLRPGALPGAQLAAIATRCAVTQAGAFHEDNRQASLGKIVSGLQPGEAAADDRDVGRRGAIQGGIFGRSPTRA